MAINNFRAMAKGKSQYAAWFSTETGKMLKVFYYNKRLNNDTYTKKTTMYDPQARKHVEVVRKDLKKPIQK